MKKINIRTTYKKMLSDVYTPVGIYLRLRDRFRDTILLESADYSAADNSFSFIGVNAIAGIEITNYRNIEFKYPAQKPQQQELQQVQDVPSIVWNFMQQFEVEEPGDKAVKIAQGLFGYSSYDAVQFFETITLQSQQTTPAIPLMRYRLYQYVIAINHFKDEMYLCENVITGLQSDLQAIESLIKSKDVPIFPFKTAADETTNMTDEAYTAMVRKGIQSCHRGDVFQIVLSRRYQQQFTGDEFNVYRALRSINPSPYLFYFDYGDYKLMGISPEAQLMIRNDRAIIHPIAGTTKRTGNDEQDQQLTDMFTSRCKRECRTCDAGRPCPQ